MTQKSLTTKDTKIAKENMDYSQARFPIFVLFVPFVVNKDLR